MKTYSYNGVNFDVPSLSTRGVEFTPKRIYIPDPNTDTSRWDPLKFSNPAPPEIVGKANAVINVRILDMPIKFPGSDICRIPLEAGPLIEEIIKIICYEKSSNPDFDEYFAYLTTDWGLVEEGTTQRKSGFHVDGYQGDRTSKNARINRSYIYSSSTPTEFCHQPFFITHIDDSKYNVFLEMDKRAEEKNIWRPNPWEIVFMNVYNVHRAPIQKNQECRFFFRLTFDVRKFDRLGNTHNPLFDYEWEMIPRETQKHLKKYEGK